MAPQNRSKLPDLLPDPFGERSSKLPHKDLQVLGARLRFESNSRRLLQLVDLAYADLPRHRLSSVAPDLRIHLRLLSGEPGRSRMEPPPLAMVSGAGLLGGTTAAANFVILSVREQSALVVVSPRMLEFPYHTRYELIEFAVFTLAARVQKLVPLHAACVGLGGRGILLMGPSGAGKTTVTLHCLLQGFDFLAEDSVFVEPGTMRATGVANFLHVRADSLGRLRGSPAEAAIRRSPVIRRRSGVRKFEVDLRRTSFRLADSPLNTIGCVFLSAQSAGSRPVLRPLQRSELRAMLTSEQAYAAGLPQWRVFSKSMARLGAYELLRGSHPLQTVEVLRAVLTGSAGHDV